MVDRKTLYPVADLPAGIKEKTSVDNKALVISKTFI